MQCNSVLVSQRLSDPRHIGDAAEPNFVGKSASLTCGASLRISLHINESQRITSAKFKAAGCSVMVASASLLIDALLGKTTAEAALLGQQPAAIMEELGVLPAERGECPSLACEALLAAIRNYSNATRDEWDGDEALICTCFCVSERTIERGIKTNALKSIAEVTALCNAGAGCGSCYPLIQDILEEVNRDW
jgi:NifU-like protein